MSLSHGKISLYSTGSQPQLPGTAKLKWKEPYMQSEVLEWDQPPVYHLLAVQPLASYITSMSLCVLILEKSENANNCN